MVLFQHKVCKFESKKAIIADKLIMQFHRFGLSKFDDKNVNLCQSLTSTSTLTPSLRPEQINVLQEIADAVPMIQVVII